MITIISDVTLNIAFASRSTSTSSRDSPLNPSERHSKVCLIVSLPPKLTIYVCRTIKSLLSSSDAIEAVINVENERLLFEIWPISHYLPIDLMVTEAWVKGTALEILENGVEIAREASKEVDSLDEAHKPILLQIGSATIVFRLASQVVTNWKSTKKT